MLLDFKENFSTEKLKSNHKGANKVFIIFMLIAIGVSMIGIWGEAGELWGRNSYTYIGIEYYIYTGWKYISSNGSYTENYLALIFTIILFIASLAITYLFGIKAFVKGIQNIANNEDCEIFGYLLLIAISQLVYFTFAKYIVSSIYSYTSIGVGWGSILSGTFLWPVIIASVIYQMIISFDKSKIPFFVGNLFLWVGSILLILITANADEGFFDNGLMNSFYYASLYSYDTTTSVIFAIEGYVSLAIVLLSIFILAQTCVSIIKGYPKKKFLPLVPPIILLVLQTFALVSNGFAKEMIDPLNVNISSTVINGFVCCVILMTIHLSNYIIANKK